VVVAVVQDTMMVLLLAEQAALVEEDRVKHLELVRPQEQPILVVAVVVAVNLMNPERLVVQVL
jgi:hypothetical protein